MNRPTSRATITRRSVRKGGVCAASTTLASLAVVAVELVDDERAVGVADELVDEIADGGAQDRLVVADQEVHGHRGVSLAPPPPSASTSSPTASTTTVHPHHDHGGSGSAAAPTVATASTHHTPQPTGAARGVDSSGTAPATQAGGQAVEHHQPGDRDGHAGWRATPTSGSRPNTTRLGRATPTWAPSVTATGIASGPSRREPRGQQRADPVTPAVAPTDSQKPTDQASSGSTQEQPDHGDGEQAQRLPLAAEGEGGGAEGGHRPGPQHRRLGPGQHDEPADQRQRRRPTARAAWPARSSGEAAATTRATFWPDTAVRWASPLARIRSHQLRRLVPVVADDQATSQRRAIRRQAAEAARR